MNKTFYPRKKLRLRCVYICLLVGTTGFAVCCWFDWAAGLIGLMILGDCLLMTLLGDLKWNRTGLVLKENHMYIRRPFRQDTRIDSALSAVAIVPGAVHGKYGIITTWSPEIKKENKKLHIKKRYSFRMCLLKQTEHLPELCDLALVHQISVKSNNRNAFLLDIPLDGRCLHLILACCNCSVYIHQKHLEGIITQISGDLNREKLKMQISTTDDVCAVRFLF